MDVCQCEANLAQVGSSRPSTLQSLTLSQMKQNKFLLCFLILRNYSLY